MKLFFIRLYALIAIILLNLPHASSQCSVQASICEQGTLSQNFNFVPTTGAYAGGAFANAGCSTGAAGNHTYGFITLYVTTSGLLNIQINGNVSTGYIDVAIFNVPSGQAPCEAIMNGANAIGCNFASYDGGCVQFGTALPCSSSVPAPYVTAGQEIVIVAQSYTAGTSTTFNLQLSSSSGSADTGIPNASLVESSLGPFCSTDGLMQLLAGNMGGIWSGTGVSSSGMFDPQAAGPGVHTINYNIGYAPCNASSSGTVTVSHIEVNNMQVSPCINGQYNVSGSISVQYPPTTGDLLIQDCSGNNVVVASAPFPSGAIPFNISGLFANGSSCSVYAYFTNSVCSQLLTYTQPTCPDVCTITNLTANTNCDGNGTYTLSGVVGFQLPPESGVLTVTTCNGQTQTFNAPFTEQLNYSFTGLNQFGQTCSVTAAFSEIPTCTATVNYTAVSNPVVVASNDVGICAGNSTTLTASGASSYTWSNGATGSSITVSPTTTTTYTVTGTTNNCFATDQITVSVSSNLVLDMSPDVAICQGQSTTIHALGGTSYSWNNGLGNQSTHSVSPSATTTYQVTAVDVNGCSGNGQIVVTVNPNPIVTSSDTMVCRNSSVILQAHGATSYTWSPATYLNSSSGATVTFTPGATSQYTITGTNEFGCNGSTTMVVTVHELPGIFGGDDFIGCQGDLITLTGGGAGPNGTYMWSGGVQNGVPFVAQPGVVTYTVTGTTQFGCSSTGSVTVNVDPIPVIDFEVTQDQYCAPVQAVFKNIGTSVASCIWNFDNAQTVYACDSAVTYFNNPGTYGASLQVTSPNGCVASKYLPNLVEVDAYPKANFTASPMVFSTSATLVNFNNTSTGAYSYEWNFNDDSPLSTEVNPNHRFPEDEGMYEVFLIAYSQHGCADTFMLPLKAEVDLIYYVPNSFTPDGDQFNQEFLPIFTAGYDPYNYTLIIYNRWGEAVFESHDSQKGWKGTYGNRGEECPVGTYTWTIEFKRHGIDERIFLSGHVNLMR